MDPPSVTAVTPFRFLNLPREVRDDIYEAAIFDLRPPDMFLSIASPDSIRFRKMNTNIVLTNRQAYWEAQDVILRRGQLIMVSFPGFTKFWSLTDSCGITGINPMYRSLCIMTHHIQSPGSDPNGIRRKNRECQYFILHRQDFETFCRVLMGESVISFGKTALEATHTLILHDPTSYGQNELADVHAIQRFLLQKYRKNFRRFDQLRIRGTSIDWGNGLYETVLQDTRSIGDRPTNRIDEIRTLEQLGIRILLSTGDLDAANVFWVKALGICDVAFWGFNASCLGIPGEQLTEAGNWHKARWDQLRSRNGSDCIEPVAELCYKLTSHRLCAALTFIQQGRHLAAARAPMRKDEYVSFVQRCYNLLTYPHYSWLKGWSAQPSEEARLCSIKAAIFSLLHATDEFVVVYRAMHQAAELAPNDESVQREKDRVDLLAKRLVEGGILGSYPEL